MRLAHTRHPRTGGEANALPIVLVHGLAESQRVWDPVLEQLCAEADVVTMDLPGFGASRRPRGNWSMEDAADSVVETATALGIDRFVLVGHSMGGGVAIVAADRAPEYVVALGLVSAAGFLGSGSGEVSARFELLHALWRGAVRVTAPLAVRSQAVRERVFGAIVGDHSAIDPRVARMFARDVARGRSSVAARAALFAADLLPVAARLEQPARLVWGAQDRLVPVGIARRLEASMQDAQLTVLAGVGHLPMWERPVETAGALLGR